MQTWIDIQHFRVAVALAEELHFTRAGEQINLGQSAMSKRLKSLEVILGYDLFLRGTGQSVSITPQGEIFVAEARSVLEHSSRSVQLSKAALGAGHHARDIDLVACLRRPRDGSAFLAFTDSNQTLPAPRGVVAKGV